MTCQMPAALQVSYLSSDDYPQNLIRSDRFSRKLKLASYKQHLDEVENGFCLMHHQIDIQFEIPVIDIFTTDGISRREKLYLHSPAKVTKWLAVDVEQDTIDPNVQHVVARKSDPKCRFIYFHGESSRAQLKTTRESLCCILSYHQIMPAYLDFMLAFIGQSGAKDPRFSEFREQIHLKTPSNGHTAPELGRSGKHYQLCYNLKGVQLRKGSKESMKLDEWSIRDVAIYHRFDVKYGTALWIVTKNSKDLRDHYEELTRPAARPDDKTYSNTISSFHATLVTHLLHCQWSTEDWRWYIIWLEDVVEQEYMAINGLRRPNRAYRRYEAWDIQELHYWQDKVNDAAMALEANSKILRALRKFYSNVVALKNFPDSLRVPCEDELSASFSQLDEITVDFDMQLARARHLVNIISDRKELVAQHIQIQFSDRTEQDTVVMRIITILTLIYLPATFVSTFFSTDIVKYQDQNQDSTNYDKGSFSNLAMKRWLQVTIPLTALTLFGAWLAFHLHGPSARDATLVERMKRTMLCTASLSSEADPYVQMPPNESPDTANVAIEGQAKHLKASISRFAGNVHKFRKRRTFLPRYEGSEPRTG